MTHILDTNPLLIDIPMPIETDRLIIRAPRAGDGPAVTAAQEETWEDLTRWMDWAKGEKPRADENEARLRRASADFILRTDLMMLAFDRVRGLPVVFTGLHRMDWQRGEFEIGYWVRTSARGQGYATEAANALTRFAFNALSARKVVITHAEGNDASAAVIKRLGFPREVLARLGTTLPDGRVVDQYKYARLDTNGLPPLDVRW